MGNKSNKKAKSELNKEQFYLKNEYKIIILGGSKIGKTSLINRLEGKEFKEKTEATEAFLPISIEINLNPSKKVSFQFIDSSAKEYPITIVKIFMKDVDGIVLGYDITRRETFEEVKNRWYPMVKDISDCNLIYLMSIKADLYMNEQVKRREGVEYAKSAKLKFFEISSKTDRGIEEFIEDLKNNLLIPPENP